MTIGSVTSTNVTGANLVNPAGMSPDALLEYCGMQLSGLDTEMDTMMNQQQTQLQQQEAVQQVQTTLEQYGSAGPQSASDMATCVQSFQTAIASLPPGDPVAAQLQTQCTQMESTYGYTPGAGLSASQQTQLSQDQATLAASGGGLGASLTAQIDEKDLLTVQNGTLSKAPANNEWQGTTDALGNLASDIKSNAEMQMLQLQDLVAQRQDVIQSSNQMMTTEDSTDLDLAKAV
jgi:hypothetical protein